MAELIHIQKSDAASLKSLNALLSQLSAGVAPLTASELDTLLADPALEIWAVVEEGNIVGTGSLIIAASPSARFALIEDVVVDEGQRGKGLGTLIMQGLVERARERGARYIDLTSRPEREAANKMYQKLGFEVRATNAYRLKL